VLQFIYTNYYEESILLYTFFFMALQPHYTLQLVSHWIGSARLGTAKSSEIKLHGNTWKPAHCIGSARLATGLSARIGTITE
jgi:hypothetical protein